MMYPTLIRLCESADKQLSFEQAVQFIRENCQPWLEQSRMMPAYRGTRTAPGKFFIRDVRTDREPVDSQGATHKAMNDAIEDAGLTANRSNAMFATGGGDVGHYGAVHVVFPVGEFNYTWSPTILDGYTNLDGTLDAHFVGWVLTELDRGRAHWIEDFYDSDLWEAIYGAYAEGTTYMKPSAVDLKKIRHAVTELGRRGPRGSFKRTAFQTPRLIGEYGKYKGDDGSLTQALASPSEIMIRCSSAVYVAESEANRIYQYLQ